MRCYFATKSGHLYYTDGNSLRLCSGRTNTFMDDHEPKDIIFSNDFILGFSQLFVIKGRYLRTSPITAIFPVED